MSWAQRAKDRDRRVDLSLGIDDEVDPRVSHEQQGWGRLLALLAARGICP